MAEGERGKSFWSTLPGLLSGTAALIAAIATLYAVLGKHDGSTTASTAITGDGSASRTSAAPLHDKPRHNGSKAGPALATGDSPAADKPAAPLLAQPSSFELPRDGMPNNNTSIGPFCCTGVTATVRTASGVPAGYVYFYGWRGQALNLSGGSVFPDIQILLSALTDLANPNPGQQKDSIAFAAGDLVSGARRSSRVGALNYTVTVLSAARRAVNGTTYVDGGSVKLRVDVSVAK